MSYQVDVRFFRKDRKNEAYASRFWASVPRVGDEVMLWCDEKKVRFKALRAVWKSRTSVPPNKASISK